MNRHLNVPRSGAFQLRHQPASVGNDQRLVPPTSEKRGDFQGATLHASRVQLGQQLEHFHASRWVKAIPPAAVAGREWLVGNDPLRISRTI